MDTGELYVSLDIGTSDVKVIIGEMTNGHLHVIGVGSASSNGLKRGSVVDIEETVGSIRKAISEAEQMVGVQIQSVIVGIGTNQVQLTPCKGVVAVASDNKEIIDYDIRRVIESARSVAMAPDRELIDVIPTQFIVDGLEEIKDPRGMIGVRLEMDGLLVTGAKTMLHNFIRCVERAGLEVTDICLQPLGAAEIALTEDEKTRGAILIDMGGGVTSVSVFTGGNLELATMIPVGGEHITRDISIVLETSRDEAERIKTKYGHAHFATARKGEVFDVTKASGNQTESYTQAEVAEIIEARLEETFELVVRELKRAGLASLPGGYVITGGGAKMSGIVSVAQLVLGDNVRIATPHFIGVREPQFTSGVGLIGYTYKKAKLHGSGIPSQVVQATQTFERENTQQQQPRKAKTTKARKKVEKDPESTVGTKVKKLFRYLWD